MSEKPHVPRSASTGWPTVLLFSIFPAVAYYTHNFREAYIQDALYALGVSALFGIITWLCVRMVMGRTLLSTTWTVILIGVFLNYIHIYTVANQLLVGSRLRHRHGMLIACALTGLLIGLAWLMYNKWPALLEGIMRAAFYGVTASMLLLFSATNLTSLHDVQLTIPSVIAPEAIQRAKDHGRPDIYYLIFDRYAHADMLKQHLGYDNSPFIDALKKKGFLVPPIAFANHRDSLHSLCSSLNMQYLEFAHEQLGSGIYPKKILYPLLQHHEVGQALKQLGYRYHHFGNWWQPTSFNAHADLNINYALEHIPNLYLQGYLENTLFGTLLQILSNTTETSQVRMFPNIPKGADGEQPLFVFAHFQLPHVPYVFRADGSTIPWQEQANTPEMYLEQLQFTNSKILELVEEILDRPTRKSVIIIQSDEGPRLTDLGFQNRLSNEDGLRLHRNILNALYLPDTDETALANLQSPVNTFRFIFTRYFGINLELLPNRAYNHPDDRILQFSDITHILRPTE